MIIYEHRCMKCRKAFDDVRPIGQFAKLPPCPYCGEKGCPQIYSTTSIGRAHVKVISAGDETTVVLNADHTPYRFKEGSEKGQKAELKRQLERQEEHLPEKYRSRFNIT